MLSPNKTVNDDGILGSSTISLPKVLILKIKIESTQLTQINTLLNKLSDAVFSSSVVEPLAYTPSFKPSSKFSRISKPNSFTE